jgi:CubicO group peptidase (beta-lactamase class C family)
MVYGQMRWAYQHFPELVPTVKVPRGDGPVFEFPRNEHEINALSFTNYDGEILTVGESLERSYTNAFLVVHRGQIVSEQYFNEMRPDTKHLVQSMTKSFTGALAAILIDEGKIQRDAPIEHYVPELKGTAYRGVTVQQLLNHTTGIYYGKDDEDLNSEASRHQQAMGWYPVESPAVPKSQRAFLLTLKKHAIRSGHPVVPGNEWDIHDGNTEVLGWIIEKVSGAELADLLSERIWSKLGTEQDALMAVDPSGDAIASSGLCATTRDLARFGQMMLQGGQFNGKQIVARDWVESLQTIRPVPWKLNEYRSAQGMLGSYRDHWFQYAKPAEAIEAQGYRGQFIYIDPSSEIVIVGLATQPDGMEAWPYLTARLAMQTVATTVTNRN